MRGKTIILALGLLYIGNAQGQTTKQFIESSEAQNTICATDIIHQRLLQEDEEYNREFHSQSEILRQSIDRQQESALRMPITYTIPVVVHVIHTGQAVGTGSNISDGQIESAIAALNEDFRKMPGTNGDGAGVDVEMEFCLASRDPNGNPSNGINRVDGSVVTNYASEGISIGQGSGASETAIKDLARWDRDDYYNIWIVNEIEDNDGGAGIQGFAYFPSSSVSKDGAVILYNAFGTVGNLKSYTSLNRTATHEIGHAFYLYHTFQGNSCSESNCSTQGDQVCDTPPTTSNTGCNSPACSGTQQVENYMDYTYETCMDMFTQGQKDRMRNALTTTRSSLLSSLGCTPPNALDAGITDINSPESFTCSTSLTPIVELTNFGSTTLSSVDIKFRVDNGSWQNYSYSGSLVQGASEMISLPSTSTSTGNHTFEAYTDSPNGGVDGYQSNDDMSTAFEVVQGAVVTVAIEVDNYGNETTWDIRDGNGDVVATGGPYPANSYGTIFESDICLSEACFDFTIYDSYGDGICCGYGFGGYQVLDDQGEVLLENGEDFEDSETNEFCVSGAGSTNPPSANFSAQQTLNCVNSSVQFSDLSSGNPNTWSWTFAGGSPATSSMQNPSVSFNSIGTKTVTLTVSNANGSDSETKTGYIVVSQAATLSASADNLSCHNSNDGSIDLAISGGVAPFQIVWNNGMSTQDIDGLGTGSYSVTVTDHAGCVANTSASISAPSPINVSNTTSSAASCSNDGSAAVSPTGGSGSYTYLWNDSQQQTSSNANNLAAGSYTVIVTDSEGCQASATVTVQGGGDIDLSSGSKSHVTCNGLADGSATVNPSGGNAPYTYLWSNGQTSATATGLAGGSHTVTVVDQTGCQQGRSFFIQEPDAIEVNVDTEDESCPGMENGEISAQISGGSSPYSFNWNGAGFGQTLNPQNIEAGSYTLNITDDNGCAASEQIVVSQGLAVQIDMLGVNETCNEADNGSINVSLQGGAPPYAYHWNGAGFGQTLNPQGVAAGDYTFTVTDSDGCQSNSVVSITQPAALSASLVEMSPDSCNLSVGRVEIQVSGGTGAKSVQWNDDESQTGTVLQGVRFGLYSAEISDENNCESFYTVEIEEADCTPTGVSEFTNELFSVYPNPIDGGSFTVSVPNKSTENLSIRLIDITGQTVELWTLNDFKSSANLVLQSNHSEGIYFVQLQEAGNTVTQKVIIR